MKSVECYRQLRTTHADVWNSLIFFRMYFWGTSDVSIFEWKNSPPIFFFFVFSGVLSAMSAFVYCFSVFEDRRVRNERHDGEAMFLCLHTDQNVATHVVLFHVVYFYVVKEPCCESFVMFSE